jgi:transmembrane sensor
MENRNHIDELIVKSLLNELDHEENAILTAWLDAGESNRKHYEALKQTWQLTGVQQTVASIQANEEWDRFQQSVQQADIPMRRPLYRRMGSLAIAASVLVLIIVGWYWWSERRPVKQKTVPVITKTSEKPAVITRKKVNSSGAEQLYRLPDGTEITLADKSELIWQEPFTNNRRDVYLKGMARFKVAKDSTKPFTVTGSKLAVTVLGTEFTMNDFDSARTIVVRLYEGKVMVHSTDIKNTYLLPGQELVYDNKLHTVNVQRFNERAPVISRDNKISAPSDDPPLPYNERGNWYMFNNQSLAQVFDQLEEIYGVDIRYNPGDVQKMQLIGKFSKSDSIETILRQIATLNHLTVVKENNGFIIRK